MCVCARARARARVRARVFVSMCTHTKHDAIICNNLFCVQYTDLDADNEYQRANTLKYLHVDDK